MNRFMRSVACARYPVLANAKSACYFQPHVEMPWKETNKKRNPRFILPEARQEDRLTLVREAYCPNGRWPRTKCSETLVSRI